VVGFQAKKERPVGARPLVAWGFEGCTTQPAVAAGLAGSEASAIRAGYRKAQLNRTSRRTRVHFGLSPVLGLWPSGPTGPVRKYFSL